MAESEVANRSEIADLRREGAKLRADLSKVERAQWHAQLDRQFRWFVAINVELMFGIALLVFLAAKLT